MSTPITRHGAAMHPFGDFRPIASFRRRHSRMASRPALRISVMTHLALDVQQAWLAELHRSAHLRARL
jgi:hypothetical protein